MGDLRNPVLEPAIRLSDAARVHVVLVVGNHQVERSGVAKASTESG